MDLINSTLIFCVFDISQTSWLDTYHKAQSNKLKSLHTITVTDNYKKKELMDSEDQKILEDDSYLFLFPT